MNDNIIFSFTWDDAIKDGTFIRVDDKIRTEAGIKYPTAITSNLYNTYIKSGDEQGRLWDLLWMFRFGKMDGNEVEFQVQFGKKVVRIIGVCEGRSPENPEPIITFMLPEDR